jgi:hypothetical protein
MKRIKQLSWRQGDNDNKAYNTLVWVQSLALDQTVHARIAVKGMHEIVISRDVITSVLSPRVGIETYFSRFFSSGAYVASFL